MGGFRDDRDDIAFGRDDFGIARNSSTMAHLQQRGKLDKLALAVGQAEIRQGLADFGYLVARADIVGDACDELIVASISASNWRDSPR